MTLMGPLGLTPDHSVSWIVRDSEPGSVPNGPDRRMVGTYGLDRMIDIGQRGVQLRESDPRSEADATGHR